MIIPAHLILDLLGSILVGCGTNAWVGFGVFVLMQSVPAVRR